MHFYSGKLFRPYVFYIKLDVSVAAKKYYQISSRKSLQIQMQFQSEKLETFSFK